MVTPSFFGGEGEKKSKGYAFLRPTRKYSRPCALARSLHGLLIFSLETLPLSAPGGGRVSSPRRPSLEFKSFYAKKKDT